MPKIVFTSEQSDGVYYEVRFWESSNEYVVYKIDTEKLRLGVQKISDIRTLNSLEDAMIFINSL